MFVMISVYMLTLQLSPPYEACFPHDMANAGNETAIIGFASGAVLVLLLVAGGFIIVLVYWRRRRARSVSTVH